MPLTESVAKIGSDTAHFTPRFVAELETGKWLIAGDLRPTDEELTVYQRYAVVGEREVAAARRQLDRIRPEWPDTPYQSIFLPYVDLLRGANDNRGVSIYPPTLEPVDATLDDVPFLVEPELRWVSADQFVTTDSEGEAFTVNLTSTPAAWHYHHDRKYAARILLGPPAFVADLALQPIYTVVFIGAVIFFMPG